MFRIVFTLSIGLSTGAAIAQTGFPSAKDVALASLAPANQLPAANAAAWPEVMVVSVLVDSAYGTLTPRATDAPFATGDRFRIKLLVPRDGEVLMYNTNPLGQTDSTPVWKAMVKASVETVSEPLQLVGNRGEDQLHVVLQPLVPEPSPFAWFQHLFGTGKATKDVRLISESTPQSTYFYNPSGEGGYVTIRIRHK
jgi:hypothetical protein